MSISSRSIARGLPTATVVVFSLINPVPSLANNAEGICTITTAPGASITQAKQQFAAACPDRIRRDCDPIGNRWSCSTASLPLNSNHNTPTSSPTPTTTTPAPTTSEGSILSMEAENASQTSGSGWSTERSLNGYTGNGYIVWRGADDFRTSDSAPPAGIKAYDFVVTQPGTYQFAARVQARVGNGNAANDKDNDAWVKFTSGSATRDVRGDASKWTKFFTSGADESWKNYSQGEQYDPTFFTEVKRDLGVGTHRVLIGGRSARFAIDSVSLQLLSASGVTQPVISVPVEPTTPSTPPTSSPTQPSPAVPSTACTAFGNNLAVAKRNYAQACPTVARADCDPVNTGGWLCSSIKFGANAGNLLPSQPTPTQPVSTPTEPTPPSTQAPISTTCSAEGDTLAQAKSNYANSCAALVRKDCDPVGNGRWQCSSGVIGQTAPGLADSQGSEPTQPTTPTTPTTPTSTPNNPSDNSRIRANDLLALHYDNCPDRDDGHAIAAGKAVVDAAGINNVIVVNGTCGAAIRWRYQPSSVNVLRAVWGNNWLDGFDQESASVANAAQRWASTLANGHMVWVAEGGPSDFTAKVLRRIGNIYPSVNRKNVRVVQHSAHAHGWNEKNTSAAGIALVKNVADYIPIPDGNHGGNGTADLQQQSSSFANTARQSRYASEWAAAFEYLDPNQKIDFSDTVELLHIINDTRTMSVNEFASNYLR